eukprot:comp22184_c1_seq1/m.32592 comp22184_c1_seq1/g.32592  ORF comp22184_c1_seq1/g.32592 comp22184_c1_seq1/m.32592 type:complete len:364 (-) comp22184_c1_seq1:48-1139(-)
MLRNIKPPLIVAKRGITSSTKMTAVSGAAAVRGVKPMRMPWETPDPFLFCVHHDDNYPRGNDVMGPDASLAGRHIGMDFEGKDGWRMYHGEKVPGFPQHPHRGFETITVVRHGLCDHSDSLKAAARFGGGDVQWLTAGKGILHSEMFPLLNKTEKNRLELFQIWLNLPRKNKLVDPHFSMMWDHQVPRVTSRDSEGKETQITLIAGKLGDVTPPSPPPKSWASDPENHVAVWAIKMASGAKWELPTAPAGINRMLYFFKGEGLRIGDKEIPEYHRAQMQSDLAATLVNGGSDEIEILMLQGRPIGEPVAQRGPFVMTTQDELRQTFVEYQQTQFGGWPWPSDEPVHPRTEGRFARHDGRVEKP